MKIKVVEHREIKTYITLTEQEVQLALRQFVEAHEEIGVFAVMNIHVNDEGMGHVCITTKTHEVLRTEEEIPTEED